MSGSDSLVIDGLPYGPAAEATAPLEGEVNPYGSPYGPCFSGRPHHPSDQVAIWLHIWGGYTQRELDLAVSLGGDNEAFGTLRALTPLDPAFELDSNARVCEPPDGYVE